MNNKVKNSFLSLPFLMRLVISVCLIASVVLLPAQSRSQDPPLDRFESSIQKFESQDKVEMPKSTSTIFVGSSSFAHWKTLESDLSDCNAINRGFGGSTIPEVNHYVERIVIKYKPARIVFYTGTNDIADGHSAQRVFDDFVIFANKVHAALPNTQIHFISMSVAPSRLQWESVYSDGNSLVRKYADATPYLHYIDVLPVMRGSDGKLRGELFLPDRLHMTAEGYSLWTPIIRAALTAAPIQRLEK